MTQEEKAKAYDEALERANKELQVCGSTDCDAAKQIFRFFPELNESEDERIRQELITHCRNTRCVTEEGAEGIAKWIAWLEKQGAKKASYTTIVETGDGGINALVKKELSTNGCNEQNPTWSEDEKIRKWLIDWAKTVNWSEQFTVTKEQVLAWLEKQKKPEDMVHITELKVWPANSATAANRQLYNRAILKILSDYIEKYPDIRFGQMLYNLGVNPHFNEESRETYCNLNETINNLL